MSKISLERLKPKYYWIAAFLLAALSMFLMLTYSQMLTSGKFVILGGDAWEIYIANIRMLIRNLSHGETVWYSFTTSMGYNTALTVAFELMSPFNILFFIFQWTDPNVILAVIIIAKIGTAAAAFQLFASKVLNNNRLSSVVFSVFYAMCAFTVEYCIANFMWLDGLYMLPVVAWATYVAVKKNKYLFLIGTYTYIFIAQFYMGYLLAGFSLIMYFLMLILQKKEERKLAPGKSILKYVLSALVSIMLSAFLWMPVLVFLMRHTASDSTTFTSLGVSPFEVLNNLFWGEFQDYHTFPYIYCGLPCMILAPFYFINKEIPKRERIVSGVLLAFFMLGCMVLPIYKLLHAFDAPDMWNYRFSFIISFILCAMAARQCEYIERMNKKYLLLLGVGLIVLYAVEQRLQPLEIGWVARNSNNGLLINAAFVLLWVLFAGLFIKFTGKRSEIMAAMMLLVVAEVVTNGFVRTFDINWKQGLTREDYFYAWEAETERNLNGIADLNRYTDEDEFYRICLYGDAVHNSDAYFGYNGITDFNSAENEALRDFMHKMGFYTSTRRTGGTGLTPPMEMLLSVKNTARLYVDMATANIATDLKVYETPYYLPVGYMVNSGILEDAEYTDNVFENQNALIYRLSGVEGIYEPVPEDKIEAKENGLMFSKKDQAFYLTNPSGGEVIFAIYDVENEVYAEIVPDGENGAVSGIEWETFMNQANSLDSKIHVPFAAQTIAVGENHMIGVEADESFPGVYNTGGLLFYSINGEKLQEAYEILASEGFKVEEYESGYIKGKVCITDERRVLFTSIPYTDGWTVKINGEEAEIIPVCNKAFCAVVLPHVGMYEVEFSYQCPGAVAGLAITVFGLAVLILMIYVGRRRKANVLNNEE